MSEVKLQEPKQQRSIWDRLFNILGGEPRSQEDLLPIIRDARHRGLIDTATLAMIEGVFQFHRKKVNDVLIQRSQMVTVETGWSFEKTLKVITKSGHSRFPVLDAADDKFVGLLLAKDLLEFASANQSSNQFELRDHLREIVFVPESQRLNVLLDKFKVTRTHMALVIAEYNDVVGLVTVEDVLEEIVGDIDDEFDVEDDDNIIPDSEGGFTVRASTPIDFFNESFGTKFSKNDYETLAGLLMKEAGRVPKKGDAFQLDGLSIRVLSANARSIKQLHVESNSNDSAR